MHWMYGSNVTVSWGENRLWVIPETNIMNISFPVFTINKVSLQAFPQNEVRNGEPLILNCSVDISKNEHFRLNYTFSFLKDGEPLITNTVQQDSARYTISQARFSSSGDYECLLTVEEKKKFSDPLTIKVEGRCLFIL